MEFLRLKIGDWRSKRLFRELIKRESDTIARTIAQITKDVPNLQYIPFGSLDDIDSATFRFESNRGWLFLLKQESYRAQLVDFFQNVRSACREARGNEQWAQSAQPQQPQQVRDRRNGFVARFQNLVSQSQDIVSNLPKQ
ncbi:MAG: hypothetical protein AB1792_06620 [Candidatus Zixiibacteriota bacterium]